jgi:hypothetical protein
MFAYKRSIRRNMVGRCFSFIVLLFPRLLEHYAMKMYWVVEV